MAEKEVNQLSIRTMGAADLPFCMQLVEVAGWNQLEGDWLRAMKLAPEGCFVGEVAGEVVATTTCCPFGTVGWIAMVLVDPKRRGIGIAGHLVDHSLRWLENKGVKSICLDATAMGEGVYRKLGFEAAYEVVRYAGTMPSDTVRKEVDLSTVGSEDAEMRDIISLDETATGANRSGFLRTLHFAETTSYQTVRDNNGTLLGYAGFRRGRNAVQIGPLIARSSEAGMKLLNAMALEFGGQLCYVDVPVENQVAIDLIEASGFLPQRSFVRMYRGEKPSDRPDLIWASSGPEKG